MRYTNICKAILRTSKENKKDYRNLMRRWIYIFEATRVVGWDRDDFLMEMIECKKEVEKNE